MYPLLPKKEIINLTEQSELHKKVRNQGVPGLLRHLSIYLTPGFGSGYDLRIMRWSPSWGSLLSGVSAGESPSPSAPPSARSLSLSLSNKISKKKKWVKNQVT